MVMVTVQWAQVGNTMWNMDRIKWGKMGGGGGGDYGIGMIIS